MVIYHDSLITHNNDEFSLVVMLTKPINLSLNLNCILSFLTVSSFKLINMEKHYFMLCNLSTKDCANKTSSSLVLQHSKQFADFEYFSSIQLSDISRISELPIQPCLA